MSSVAHTLYRFFNAEDTLLYVGMSINPGRRMEKHRASQPWWSEVARIEMEQYPDLETLRAAEREAIKAEAPRYNVRMNGRYPEADYLVWTCKVCSREIADGEGYLAVSFADIRAYREARDAWDRRVRETYGDEDGGLCYPATELRDYPEHAAWVALHHRCDPRPDSDDYWFHVERIRTPRHALSWSAHLLGKVWLQDTNWDDILEDISEYA